MKFLKSYPALLFMLLCLLAPAKGTGTVSGGGDTVRKSADVYLISGVEQYLEGRMVAADSLLNMALKLNPDNDAARYYLGNIATSAREPGKALEHYETAYRLDTNNVWYAMRLAKQYSALGKLRDADGLYVKLRQKRPYDPDLLAEIAELYVKQNRYDEADSVYSILEKVSGPSDYIQLSRLELYHIRGRYPEFFSGLDDYFSRDDVSAEAKTKMLEGLIHSGNSRFNFYHLGDYVKLMETCLAVHPDDTSVIHMGATFFYSAGNDSRALELCEKCPDNFQMALLKVYVMSRKKDYAGVAGCCAEALLLTKNREDKVALHTMMGDAWQMMGERKKAYAEYEAALDLNPDDLVTLNNYAYFMACEGRNLAKCAKMSKKVVDAKPADATSLDTYAWILFKQKKYSQAKAVFKKALLCGGKDNAEVLRHYAQTLEALGEKKEAEIYYERAKLKEDAQR